MIFTKQTPLYMHHLQIIKEHIYIRRLIAHINIQITVLINGHICFGMCFINTACIHLFKAAIAGYKLKLFIQQYPVNISFWFACTYRLAA